MAKKKGKFSVKKILLGVLLGFVVMQFVRMDHTNPPVDKEKDFYAQSAIPMEIRSMIKNSCYDCHSHETTYPWYSEVAPVSWFVNHHVEEGREELNFSQWTDYSSERQAHKLEECAEEIEEGEMPLSAYVLFHNEAKLSHEDGEKLMNWMKNQANKNGEND